MKIALIGASGNIGREIAREAVRRGHTLTAITRSPQKLSTELAAELPGVIVKTANLFDAAELCAAVAGNEVIASAFGPGAGAASGVSSVPQAVEALIGAARASGIERLVVVGGAGSLEIAPGKQLVDSPDFPEAYRNLALAHRDAFKRLRQADDLQWTFFSPAAMIGPGEKVGRYRVGRRTLIADADGNSRISYADYADAFVSELENKAHPQEIVTAAY